METIHFENRALPIYSCRESRTAGNWHSEMPHWHDNIELISISKGCIDCRAAGSECQLHEGDVCFINRKQMHGLFDGGQESAHKVLIIDTSLFVQNPLIYEKYMRPLLEDTQFSHARFESGSSTAVNISIAMDRIEKILRDKEGAYEFEVFISVHRICKQLYLAYSSGQARTSIDSNALVQQKMAEYIYANFADSLSLDRIAEAGGVSRSQCTKLFRTYTGLPPIAFLNRHRLEVSCDYLRSSDDNVAVIAGNCGFSDQSYFNRMFLREYHCTPLEWRRRR